MIFSQNGVEVNGGQTIRRDNSLYPFMDWSDNPYRIRRRWCNSESCDWFRTWVVLSLTILIIGILLFFVTFGLWQLKMWAWWLVIILNVIQIVLGIGSAVFQGSAGPIIGIIIPVIIVIYLWTVKDHFR